MRLHQLRVTGFGPFPETIAVDFDVLSDSGIFLFSGDTGAGKSTVLDAICFAFYGDVPNSRAAAKQLKSHHSDPMAAPEVVLEASIGGVRYRFTRSPAWSRPKKRGTGTTTEPAKVRVEVHSPTGWELRSNRLDEAGLLVTDLLGMNLDQFSQVALLPQGKFDTFLRASSEERQQLLTQLFRTRRFEDVEKWLSEHRLQLRRAEDRLQQSARELLARFSEAANVALPEDSALVDPPDLPRWAESVIHTCASALAQADETAEAAAQVDQSAQRAVAAATRTLSLRAQHDDAVEELTRLTADQARIDALQDRVRLATAATSVAPLIDFADEAATRAADAESTSGWAVARAASLLADLPRDPQPDTEPACDPFDVAGIATATERITRRVEHARSFLPRAEELGHLEADFANAGRALATAEAELERTTRSMSTTEESLAELDHELSRISVDDAQLRTTTDTVRRLEATLAAHQDVARLEAELATATETWSVARQEREHTEAQLRELVELRFGSMAAELAEAMVVGEDCPVCGSVEHPRPARPSPDSPSKSDETRLRRRLDDQAVLVETHADRRRGLIARVEVLRAPLGPESAADIRAALMQATRQLERLEQAREASERLLSQQQEASAQLRRLRDGHAAQVVQHAVLAERVSGLRAQLEKRRAELADVLGDAESLQLLIDRHGSTATALAEARDALIESQRAAEAAAGAVQAADEAARAAGFANSAAACAARIDAPALAVHQNQLAAHQQRKAAAESLLASPDIVAAVASGVPDLVALTAAAHLARHEQARAQADALLLRERVARLNTLRDALDESVRQWIPVAEQHHVAHSVATLADGKSPDNHWQMRLSAYVLVARLGHVVAAANERLHRMTDQRFELEHATVRAVGERRGGLSLRIRDNWTDETRDPVTLSGGETFVVSLALALGLADVVTAESGGTRIDTLFVDEGFGALDADTLEAVMDTLDQLREGGRSVGVVSHVAELRDRIPTQLRVLKSSTGSTVEQHTASLR